MVYLNSANSAVWSEPGDHRCPRQSNEQKNAKDTIYDQNSAEFCNRYILWPYSAAESRILQNSAIILSSNFGLWPKFLHCFSIIPSSSSVRLQRNMVIKCNGYRFWFIICIFYNLWSIWIPRTAQSGLSQASTGCPRHLNKQKNAKDTIYEHNSVFCRKIWS